MEVMGEEYVTPPVLNLDDVFEQSNAFTPVVFILSPGADPGKDLLKLSKRCGVDANSFQMISLGQGQEPVSSPIITDKFLSVLIPSSSVHLRFTESHRTLSHRFATRPMAPL